jgi:hypothetical protein
MTATEVLSELRKAGIRVEPRPTGNLYLAPRCRLTPELIEQVRAHKAEILNYLKAPPESGPDPVSDIRRPLNLDSPAYSLVDTCQRCGIFLGIDPETGDLVVGKEDARVDEPCQPWPSLIIALEAHYGAVSDLVRRGWTLKAKFPEAAIS